MKKTSSKNLECTINLSGCMSTPTTLENFVGANGGWEYSCPSCTAKCSVTLKDELKYLNHTIGLDILPNKKETYLWYEFLYYNGLDSVIE